LDQVDQLESSVINQNRLPDNQRICCELSGASYLGNPKMGFGRMEMPFSRALIRVEIGGTGWLVINVSELAWSKKDATQLIAERSAARKKKLFGHGIGLISLAGRFLISEVIRVISFWNQNGFTLKLEEAASYCFEGWLNNDRI
jgi:hypothetical protein